MRFEISGRAHVSCRVLLECCFLGWISRFACCEAHFCVAMYFVGVREGSGQLGRCWRLVLPRRLEDYAPAVGIFRVLVVGELTAGDGPVVTWRGPEHRDGCTFRTCARPILFFSPSIDPLSRGCPCTLFHSTSGKQHYFTATGSTQTSRKRHHFTVNDHEFCRTFH